MRANPAGRWAGRGVIRTRRNCKPAVNFERPLVCLNAGSGPASDRAALPTRRRPEFDPRFPSGFVPPMQYSDWR